MRARFFLCALLAAPAYAERCWDRAGRWAAVYTPAAATERLDPRLIRAVIAAESCANPRAVSHAGAKGLMQLMPATARRFGVSDAFDPKQNIGGGVRYLRWLLDYFNGDLKLALAGYNAGEGRVRQYNGVPPFKETRRYVKKVLALLGNNERVMATDATPSSAYARRRKALAAALSAPLSGAGF